MPVTNYYSVNGVIIAEHTTGQGRLDYVADALGSVIATVDQTLTVKSTARYKPYGAVLSETGTQPLFGYVGGPGYRRTNLPHSDAYVRKRHLSSFRGCWTTIDPLWPIELAFAYLAGSPVSGIDSQGTQLNVLKQDWCQGVLQSEWSNANCQRAEQLAYADLKNFFNDKDARYLAAVMSCIAAGEPGCNPKDSTKPVRNKHGNLVREVDEGLYSLCSDQWSSYGGRGSFLDNVADPVQSTAVTVNMIVSMIKTHRSAKTLSQAICDAYGVLYCYNRNGAADRAQNNKAMCCLQSRGLLNIYSSKPPNVIK